MLLSNAAVPGAPRAHRRGLTLAAVSAAVGLSELIGHVWMPNPAPVTGRRAAS